MTTDEIQQEIERTRGEMAGTLQAIERKLSPRQLMNQAVDTMRDLTSGDTRIGSMVRENPVPLAIIGLGLGWLALSSATGRREEEVVEAAREEMVPALGTSGYGAEGGEGFAPMGETGRSMRDRAGRMAREARQGLQRATNVTRRQMSEWGRDAGGAMGDAAERTRDLYQDHPLTMALGAAALGAMIGALVPRTHAEGQMMTDTVRDAVRQARETGNELVERAGRAARGALRSARRRGEEAAEVVTEGASEAASKAESTMH